MDTTSDYANPLDAYRSFAYHYVLVASGTTEAFRVMINNEKTAAGSLLGEVLKAKLGESFTYAGKEAWLILDTRRFSQFNITELEMEHVWGTGNRVNPTVPTGVLKMKLIDTTGLSFFNYMMDLMREKLHTSSASAFFLLSISFIGHKDDGTTELISTCNIPLTLLLLGFEFTSSGSVFDIEFMEIEGSPQRGATLENLNSLGDVQSISTKNRGNTLGAMVDALEEELNVKSLETFQKFQNAYQNLTGKKTTYGKLVQYMINIPPEWRGFKIINSPSSQNEESKFKEQKPKQKEETEAKKEVTQKQVESNPAARTESFGPTMGITEAIKKILESSKELTDLQSKEKLANGTAISFKTTMSITSDDATFVIHADIYPFYLPKVKDKNESNSNVVATGTSGNSDAINSKNVIHYNYIFTGRNSHITDLKVQYNPESVVALDVNLDLGGPRFASNARDGQVLKKEVKTTVGQPSSKTEVPNLRAHDPIFFALKSIDQKSNMIALRNEAMDKTEAAKVAKSKQEYTATMASIHFLGSLMLEMGIRGNPQLIRKYADRGERSMPPHPMIIDRNTVNELVGTAGKETQKTGRTNFYKMVQEGVSQAKIEYVNSFYKPRVYSFEKRSSTSGDALIGGPDVAVMPLFVTVKILAPNVDFSTGEYLTNQDSSEGLFTDMFFYNGVYQVLLMRTTFSNGTFQHSLTLNPWRVDALENPIQSDVLQDQTVRG